MTIVTALTMWSLGVIELDEPGHNHSNFNEISDEERGPL
jgi:hypothetical protein